MQRVKVMLGLTAMLLAGLGFGATATVQTGHETPRMLNPRPYAEGQPEMPPSVPMPPSISDGLRGLKGLGVPLYDTAKRLTNDPRDEYAASIVQLQNGDLLVAYDRWNAGDTFGWRMLTRSTDEGAHWSTPESIISGGGKSWPRIAQTADGTVWMFYRDWRHPPSYDTAYISYLRSSDNGHNWSSEWHLPARPGFKTGSYPFQPTADRIWVFYSVYDSATGYDIYYESSTDNGNTWIETPFVVGAGNQYVGDAIFKDHTGRIWILYTEGDTAFYKTSTDTGQTWLGPFRMPYGGAALGVVDPAGKFWLGTGRDLGPYNHDLYYFTSTDNGLTWSDTIRTTRFAGMDRGSDIRIVGGQPWLFFHSDRSLNGDIYYGILGSLVDPNPPPYLPGYDSVWSTNPCALPGPILKQRFSAVALCLDETGIGSVTLVYSVEGVPQPDLTLYDDGQHGDLAAGDGRYGNFLGPFMATTSIQVQVRITDVDGNTILAPQYPLVFDVVGVHDTSNLQLYISPADGSDGSHNGSSRGPYPSCEWPARSGNNYLFGGHTWVGAVVGGDTLVDFGYNPNSGTSDLSLCNGDTMRWWSGLSDWDSYLKLDDRNNRRGRPIGIEVHKHSLSWHHWRYGDFIIQKYVYRNMGLHGDLHGVYVGFCHDFDIIEGDGTNDLAGCDALRGLSYMHDAAGHPNGYIGVRMLSPQPTSLSWWTINSDPPTDAAMYRCLTSDTAMGVSTTPGDYRTFESVGPFDLAVGDSDTVVVGIVIGDGLQGLRQNADEMKGLYDRGYVAGIAQPGAAPSRLVSGLNPVQPNPTGKAVQIRYQIAAGGPVSLEIFGASGRLVKTLVNRNQKPGAYRTGWDRRDDLGRAVAEGVYFISLDVPGFHTNRKVVLSR